MPSATNKTKIVKFARGQDAPGGGFINVASLMHDVVTKMVANGFRVVYASSLDTNLNTVAWGTLSAAPAVSPSTNTLTWTAGATPGVGSPVSGSTYRIGTGPTACIVLEAIETVNYLNPIGVAQYTGSVGGVGGQTLPREPWRVKFELLSTECVTAYVATPLQLPGYVGSGTGSVLNTNIIPEGAGLPGSHSRITDGTGNPVDSAGAIGSQQIIGTRTVGVTTLPAYQQVSSVLIANGGTGYAVGDYIAENAYVASSSPGSSGITVTTGASTAPPSRGRAIFRVDTVTLATVTGYIATTTMTVTAVTTGPLTIGLVITGVGVTAGTSISKQLTNTDTSVANQVTGGVLTGVVISAASTIKITSLPAALAAGQFVVGTGITADAIVSAIGTFNSVDSTYTVTLSTTAGAALTMTPSATPIAGNVTFYTPGSTGTYTVSTSQTAGSSSSTITIVGTTGPVKSLGVVDPGKYISTATTSGLSAGPTLKITGAGVGCTLNYTLSTGAAAVDETDSYQGLYNRGNRVGAQGASYPLTYELSITNSGFFLGIYESNWATQVGGTTTTDDVGRFNWMLVQRPVNRVNGVVLDNYDSSTSKHPIFCVNGVGGRYYTFVVREKDIAHPTAGPAAYANIKYYDAYGSTTGTLVSPYASPQISTTLATQYASFPYRVPATLNTEDNHLLFNPENQISLTEDKKYLVTFPHNLSTPRFRYTEELDMIGFTSSDVLMTGQEISINTYQTTGGDATGVARTYLALPPSGKYNTGLRICVVRTTGNS